MLDRTVEQLENRNTRVTLRDVTLEYLPGLATKVVNIESLFVERWKGNFEKRYEVVYIT